MPKLALRAHLPRPGDPDIIKLYADAIRKGHPVVTAATIAGLSVRTVNSWLALGEDEADAYDAAQDADSDAYDADAVLGSHVPFLLAVREAEAASVDAHLSVFDVISDKPGHWQRSAWYLERKYAGTFGMRQHTTVDTRSVSVNVTLEALPEGQREALIAALSRTPPQAQLTGPTDTTDDIT